MELIFNREKKKEEKSPLPLIDFEFFLGGQCAFKVF